jgi:hypothetical protein
MSDDNLFLEHKHPVSGLLAVLEDDGTSAWLYISNGESRRPVADAWVYNRIAAPALEAIQSYRGGPPPAAQGYAGEGALCDDPSSYEWSFVWSPDGQSVAVTQDGQAVAFIIGGQKGGYSRELVKDGPWGHPWSEKLFQSNFSVA